MQLKSLYNYVVHFVFRTQLGRFGLVGASAFTVNALLLYVFHGLLALPILIAQILGAEGTIIFSFLLHHHWTYRHYRQKHIILRFLEFNGSAIGGSLISTVSVLTAVELFHIHYLIGLGVGAILAMCWNYFSNQYFIWTKQASKQAAPYEDHQ